MRWLKWKDDSFFSKQGMIIRYDKLEHLLGCFGLTFILIIFSMFTEMSILIPGIVTFIAGLLWEVKDGYLDWEKYNRWGGEGFSWKDLIANLVGILLAYGVLVLGLFVIFKQGMS
jgi:VanZ family protein